MTRNIDKLQIYSILQQIEQLLEASPRAKLASGNKRVVDLDALYDLLGDLKVSIPDDVRMAQSVIAEVDSIINEADERAHNVIQSAERRASMTIDKANAKAEQLVEEATTIFEQKVGDHPVYLEAQKRAQQVMRKAEYNSTVIFEDAKRNTDQILSELLSYLSTYQSEISSKRAKLNVRARNARVEDISHEQEEHVQENPTPAPAPTPVQTAAAEPESAYRYAAKPAEPAESPYKYATKPAEPETPYKYAKPEPVREEFTEEEEPAAEYGRPQRKSFMENVKSAFSNITSAFYEAEEEEEEE